MFTLYLVVYIILMYTDLFNALGNLKQMVENIMDSTIVTTAFFMLFLVRCNKVLARVIMAIKSDIAENNFKNLDEMRLYLSYNQISDAFERYAVSVTSATIVVYYFKPLILIFTSNSVCIIVLITKYVQSKIYDYVIMKKKDAFQLFIITEETNGSTSYVLPFRVYAFLDYHDNFNNYLIMYAYQLPLMMLGLCHVNTVSLLLNLILHICGKLSIITYRAENIATRSSGLFHHQFRELINSHEKLIRMANSINSAFRLVLMIELIQTSIRMAVLIYMILLGADGNLVSTFVLLLYILIVISMLYLYSFIGEQLSYESKKVWDAFYASNWLELSNDNRKILLIALCNRKPLLLTAGKVYTFSMFGFIGIMKTVFGFASLLRTVV
ncbi:uncharacterized protein LOC143177342 [Calliopsis andreniformis]|uniref:uncharacterized protein LOC143177342 n=1 Tax=Calliopsis andreniformis TaxID=337506 RepID=UPI003FCCF0EE